MQMEEVYQHCRATCSKARDLLDKVELPADMTTKAQQHIHDLDELLKAGSIAPLTGGSLDALMLITCSGMDLASVCIDTTIHLSTELTALKGRVMALEGEVNVLKEDMKLLKLKAGLSEHERELRVLKELKAQCENKLYRMCLTVPLEPKEVVQGTLTRLMGDKRLDKPLLEECLSKWPVLASGLKALKDMGGLAVAHPQPLDVTEEKLLELVDKHAAPLVKEDILQVVQALVHMAGVHNETLFVKTM